MKRLIVVLFPLILLAACQSRHTPTISSETGGKTLLVDYRNDGGANIPTEWNESDTGETVRQGTFDDGFKLDFVGKWYVSNNKKEYQTKKDPVSYIRAASDLVIQKVVVEVFMADFEVYLTNDHIGNKLEGKEVAAGNADGTAYEYVVNSKNWSVLFTETYKGSSINIYSFTFYF